MMIEVEDGLSTELLGETDDHRDSAQHNYTISSARHLAQHSNTTPLSLPVR